MRFDVHTVRCHLVNELLDAPQVKEVWHDGSDVVILDFKSQETVSIHLIERYMSVDEIRYIFSTNAAEGKYTLLLLWADMFMPAHGQKYEPDDWMITLLSLYGGKIYVYDAWRTEPYIFTVHFHPIANSRLCLIEHGADIHIGKIGVEVVNSRIPYFFGAWRVARFDGYRPADEAEYWESLRSAGNARHGIRHYFALFGLEATATREAVKQAYRELARKIHPDRNAAEDATSRMQQVNEAYTRIVAHLDAEESDSA
jgi:hypothetical protein